MLTDVLQPTHLIIVLVIALLILGPKRLPDAGRALGQGINEFKHSIRGTHDGNTPVQVTPTPKTQDGRQEPTNPGPWS